MKKHETEPFAYGLLAGLSVLWFVFVALACGSCTTRHLPPAARPAASLDFATVKIELLCINDNPFSSANPSIDMAQGSGVVLGGRKVLTANHVIDCAYLADIHVLFVDGTRVKAALEKAWPDRDIAKLVLERDSGLAEVGIVSPRVGERVCVSAAVPVREQSCGGIELMYEKPTCAKGSRGGPWCYDMSAMLTVVSGNSGSGVYNDRGQLVALATGSTSMFGVTVPVSYLTSLDEIDEELSK